MNRKGFLLSLYDCVKKKFNLFYFFLQINFFFFLSSTYQYITFVKRTTLLQEFQFMNKLHFYLYFIITHPLQRHNINFFYLQKQSIMQY
jgi:hypothetical protein